MGDAPTSCPVFRSWRLSLEIVAHANTIAVTKSARATSAWRVAAVGETASANTDAQMTIDRMPTPEIGLFDAPIRPAMYPQTPAMMNPTMSTNGTDIKVSLSALGASTVERAKVNASQAAITRHTAVRAKIHGGERSRSRSSATFDAREAASVLTSPPSTGLARVPRV